MGVHYTVYTDEWKEEESFKLNFKCRMKKFKQILLLFDPFKGIYKRSIPIGGKAHP